MTDIAMTETLKPSSPALLATVRSALKDTVAPELTDIRARSALTSIDMILRHVALRIEDEGQVLTDDAIDARALLGGALGWLDGQGAQACAEAIRAALAITRDPAVYPSLAMMGEEAGHLRALVRDVLVLLLEHEAAGRADAASDTLHDALRGYLGRQIEREAQLVEPAFRGFGPRR